MRRSLKQLKRVPFKYWLFYFFSIIVVAILNTLFYSSTEFQKKLDLLKNDQNNQNSATFCNCRKCDPTNHIIYNEVEEITFISVPRPLKKDKAKRSMKLALSSWLAASPKSHVLLFINRTEFDKSGKFTNEIDQLFGKDRVIYAGDIRTDLKNVPYINEWFIQGIMQSPSKYVCFINSDIVLSSNWLKRVKQVFSIPEMQDKPLVLIGQRIDFDLKEESFKTIEFSKFHNNEHELLNEIDSLVNKSQHSDHSPYGVDTFTFRADKPPFDPYLIPPFIMGRYNWDNWIIGWLNHISETITFNLNPPIYHINHIRHGFDVNDSRVAINHHLKKANLDYFGSNYDTKWQIKDGKLKRRGRHKEYTLKSLDD